MMLVCTKPSHKAVKAVIEEQPEGWYVFVWTSSLDGPCTFDYLQDDLAMAKRCASNRFGIDPDAWHEVMNWDEAHAASRYNG